MHFIKSFIRTHRVLLIQIATALLILLWSYAAFSKLLNYTKSLSQMRNQVFPEAVAVVLTWLIPALELLVTAGLLFAQTRALALRVSFILLGTFTVYIAIVKTGYLGRIPCSCGGVLQHMSYKTHMLFNLFFMAIAFFAMALEHKWKIINRWFNP